MKFVTLALVSFTALSLSVTAVEASPFTKERLRRDRLNATAPEAGQQARVFEQQKEGERQRFSANTRNPNEANDDPSHGLNKLAPAAGGEDKVRTYKQKQRLERQAFKDKTRVEREQMKESRNLDRNLSKDERKAKREADQEAKRAAHEERKAAHDAKKAERDAQREEALKNPFSPGASEAAPARGSAQ